MDRAEVWKLEEDLIPPFIDHKELQPSKNQYHYSFSNDGQFESSFSSSVTSYDECYTPSRRDSFGMSDLSGLFSSRTSLGSNGSSSPIDGSTFYSMTSMNHMVKDDSDDKSPSYVTPCRKTTQDHHMDYDYLQVNGMYGPFDIQHDFSDVPEMMFDNVPGLLFHDTTSPLTTTSSPGNFVVPSQTFMAEPYRPTTPKNMPRAVLGSPLEEDSSSKETIKYFMSPRETHSLSPSSSISSGLHSITGSTSLTVESSVALHRIQSINGSRISKRPRRFPQASSKVDRVSKGAFYCDISGCTTERGFKRHEHLKRHKKTHGAQKGLQCVYCKKWFQADRSDNYRSHVIRHSEIKKGSRTKYFPEAILEVNSWKKKREADKRLGVPGEMYRVYSRRVKAGSLLKSKL